MGTKRGLESRVIPKAGYDFQTIDIRGLRRSLTLDNFKTLGQFVKSSWDSRRILSRFQPQVVVGMGSYVSLPVVLAAAMLKIPVVIHEQNIMPGLANRLSARVAQAIAVSYEKSAQFFPQKTVTVTGNPVRKEILTSTRDLSLKTFNLEPGRKTVLIFGGSRGARQVNQATVEAYLLWCQEDRLQIIHVTGMVDFEYVTEAIRKVRKKSDKISYQAYQYLDNIADAYAACDLVVCRAGAITLAELTAKGRPSLLIPYPYATAGHQEKNARALEKEGAARVLLDEQLNGDSLFNQVSEIIFDDKLLQGMRESSRKLGKPQAAKKLAQIVVSVAK